MLKINQILAGTDFTDTPRGSVREAMRIAAELGASLTLAHVAAKESDELLARLEQWFHTLDGADAFPSDSIRFKVVTGRVAPALANLAQDLGADLICVGPLAKTFAQQYIVGGVAEQLFSRTHVPILATTTSRDVGYQRVLVAVDFSDVCRRVATTAADLVRSEDAVFAPGARLALVNAFEVPGGTHAPTARRQLEQRIAKNLRADLRVFARDLGISDVVEDYHALPGAAQFVVPQLAEDTDADLICMGSIGSGDLKRRILGSTTSAVLESAKRPLLVLWP